jgi:hypothetical protein
MYTYFSVEFCRRAFSILDLFYSGTFVTRPFEAGPFVPGPFEAGPFEAGPFVPGPFEPGTFKTGPFEAGRFVGVLSPVLNIFFMYIRI